MSVTHEPETHNSTDENVIAEDKSTHICTNCGYKREHKKQDIKWSIVLIAAGIISIPFSISMDRIWIIGSFLIIAAGIYGVYTNYRKYVKCPNCGKNTYIPIDSPEAQEILKKHNISVAKEFNKNLS